MQALLQQIAPNVYDIQGRIVSATAETIYMALVAGIFVLIFGILFGVILVVTRPTGIMKNPKLYNILSNIISAFRSIPFIIMMAILAPVTKLVVGTRIGTTAAIIPLIMGMVPFYSKQVENALLEVDYGIVEAAIAMGASNIRIIFSVYLKEGLPSLIRTTSVSIINLISLTAMAGTIGGGGLGDLAINRGYNRFQNDVTWTCTIIIMLLVGLTQLIGHSLAKRVEH